MLRDGVFWALIFNSFFDLSLLLLATTMQDIAEAIVKQARMLPVDTGVALECNGAVITKVAVTGGFGFQVTDTTHKIGDRYVSLLFPMVAVHEAVVSFLTTGHEHEEDFKQRYNPVVFHANGLPLLKFQWNDKKARQSAQRLVSQLLLQPPLCHDMQTAAQSSLSFGARGLSGWDIGSVQPMNEDAQETPKKKRVRSDSEEEEDDEL